MKSLEKGKPLMRGKELTKTSQPMRSLFVENLEQTKKYKLVIHQNFSNNIWGKETPCNMQADWIEKLEKKY